MTKLNLAMVEHNFDLLDGDVIGRGLYAVQQLPLLIARIRELEKENERRRAAIEDGAIRASELEGALIGALVE